MTRSRGLGDETGTGPAREADQAAEGRPLPAPGFAEVRIVAASAEAARTVAHLLRSRFAGSEQSGGTTEDGGTYLHLTVDTVHFPETAGPVRLRLVSGGRDRDRAHGVVPPAAGADAAARADVPGGDAHAHAGSDASGGDAHAEDYAHADDDAPADDDGTPATT